MNSYYGLLWWIFCHLLPHRLCITDVPLLTTSEFKKKTSLFLYGGGTYCKDRPICRVAVRLVAVKRNICCSIHAQWFDPQWIASICYCQLSPLLIVTQTLIRAVAGYLSALCMLAPRQWACPTWHSWGLTWRKHVSLCLLPGCGFTQSWHKGNGRGKEGTFLVGVRSVLGQFSLSSYISWESFELEVKHYEEPFLLLYG